MVLRTIDGGYEFRECRVPAASCVICNTTRIAHETMPGVWEIPPNIAHVCARLGNNAHRAIRLRISAENEKYVNNLIASTPVLTDEAAITRAAFFATVGVVGSLVDYAPQLHWEHSLSTTIDNANVAFTKCIAVMCKELQACTSNFGLLATQSAKTCSDMSANLLHMNGGITRWRNAVTLEGRRSVAAACTRARDTARMMTEHARIPALYQVDIMRDMYNMLLAASAWWPHDTSSAQLGEEYFDATCEHVEYLYARARARIVSAQALLERVAEIATSLADEIEPGASSLSDIDGGGFVQRERPPTARSMVVSLLHTAVSKIEHADSDINGAWRRIRSVATARRSKRTCDGVRVVLAMANAYKLATQYV